jgi:hypothetical protein
VRVLERLGRQDRGRDQAAGRDIKVETGDYCASTTTQRCVTGGADGSFVDRRTGTHDFGFSLPIVDFLLEPASPQRASPAGQFSFGPEGMVQGHIYRCGEQPLPERFISADQVTLSFGDEGSWLAGVPLRPEDLYQGWCHQRGYVCLIEELGGHPPGDTFGACYLIGWVDDLDSMHKTHERFRGWIGLPLEGTEEKPNGYNGLARGDLTAVPTNDGESLTMWVKVSC